MAIPILLVLLLAWFAVFYRHMSRQADRGPVSSPMVPELVRRVYRVMMGLMGALFCMFPPFNLVIALVDARRGVHATWMLVLAYTITTTIALSLAS